MIKLSRRQFVASLAAVAVPGMQNAHADNGPIRLVVPFGPGGVQDIVARAFAQELGTELKQTVIVENRAGGGATIGAAAVAKAAPDGKTLLIAAASHNLAAHLYKRLPYDTQKDFVGAASVGALDYVLMVSSQMQGVNSIEDFVRVVKANPGKFNYSSGGNGSATHLGMASLLSKAGLTMTHIPLKSSGDAVNEVVAGRVEAAISGISGVIGFKGDPRVKFIGVTGKKPSGTFPGVPRIGEKAVPGYVFDTWLGLLAPAQTPKATLERINQAMNRTLAVPAVQERLDKLTVVPQPESVEGFNRMLAANFQDMGAVVRASGASVD